MKQPNDSNKESSSHLRTFFRSKHVWVAFALFGAVTGVGAIRTQIVSAFQDDACQQISIAVAEKIENGDAVTQELLNDTVTHLIRANVINGQIDTDGNPKDYNGNAFQINVTDGIVTTSTKRSAFHPLRSNRSWKVGG